jgi:hypothetical protein
VRAVKVDPLRIRVFTDSVQGNGYKSKGPVYPQTQLSFRSKMMINLLVSQFNHRERHPVCAGGDFFPGLGFNGILSLFGCAERRSILPYLGSLSKLSFPLSCRAHCLRERAVIHKVRDLSYPL